MFLGTQLAFGICQAHSLKGLRYDDVIYSEVLVLCSEFDTLCGTEK
jgi:hypothetical protein